jgi:uncharacterized protein
MCVLYLFRKHIPIYSMPVVTKHNNEFRINVGFFLTQVIGSSREFNFNIHEIEFPPDLMLHDFKGRARIYRTPQGLLVNAEVKACVDLDCVRCLEKYQQPLHAEFDELYAFSIRTATDSGLILPDDGYIDLRPLVREYVLIEIPINPQCKEDCRGLCPVCGTNQNLKLCTHS